MKNGIGKIGLLIGLVYLASCTAGSALHREGMEAAERGEIEESIRLLEEAVQADPGNMTYKLDLKSQRDQAIQTLVALAGTSLDAGDFNAAEAYYQHILKIEPRNGQALRGLDAVAVARAHSQMVADAKNLMSQGEIELAAAKSRAILAEDPGNREATSILEKIDSMKPPVSVTPRLVTANNAPVSLQFRDANTQMVFEVLSRQTGINFIFDKDVRRDSKTTIFVRNVPIEQVIDLILGQNQLGRQILSDNMVMIYPNTAAKKLEYQDQIVKTFYLTNAEPKQFSEMLKMMLGAQTVFVEPRSNAVIVRDTPELIRMAEHLQASIDLPEAEVMMEVEVLEIRRSKLEQLGIQYPGSVTLNPTPLAGEPLVLADIPAQDSTTIQITPIPVTVDFRKEVGASNLLASPRIRARNHEKAKILIGERVPVITNSVTPTAGGTSVVTGSVQYVDVGLSLEVEPTIHLDGEVAINVDLEVSNIISEIFNSTSGTLAYQIGTRNATTVLRLRDGETQILAGLIQDIDRETSNRVAGLGDLPILGRLFSSNKNDAEKSEIVLSITPRIIRAQPRPSSEQTEFWFGTESNMRSSLASTAYNTRQGGSAQVANTATVGRSANQPQTPDRPATDNTPTPQRLSLSWDGPAQVAVGEEFTIKLEVSSVAELASLKTRLRYDRSALELASVDFGDFLPAGLASSTTPEIVEQAGRVDVDIAKVSETTASGDGALVLLHFKAISARPGTMIAVQQFAALGEDDLSIPVMAPQPMIVVVTQ